MRQNTSTSWGRVADWYHEHLKQPVGTYHREVILPNLLRLMNVTSGETILDLACGQGFFSRELFHEGAKVIGVDIAPELVRLAKKHSPQEITYHISPADDLSFLKTHSVDKILISLAIQNIENVRGVFDECRRVLKPGGKLFIVMNHPAFRIPKQSSWGWEGNDLQYRRIDRYLSEARVKIQMHPGDAPSETTISFHRPLQFYFKMLNKSGFAVTRLEEWISHKKSKKGSRAAAEDRARKEIPLFLFLEATIV